MKKFLLLCSLIALGFRGMMIAKMPPSYEETFVSPLREDLVDLKVSKDKTLKENLMGLLYPNGVDNYGFLGDIFKGLALALILVYVFFAGASLLTSGSKSDVLKKEVKSLGYLALGAVLIYGAGWFFGEIFNVSNMAGIEGFAKAATGGNTSFFFQFLTLLKGFAFFYAILMVVITGFRTMTAESADKSKKIIKGTLNVLGSLTLMKMVDFVYYIASIPNFVAEATTFIVNVAKFCGYLYGAVAVLMVFYAGYSFLTDGGGGSGFKRAKTLLVNLFVSGLVLFGFLLILYQVFDKFSH